MAYLALALIGAAPWLVTMIAFLKGNYEVDPGPFCVSTIVSLTCAMCAAGVYVS